MHAFGTLLDRLLYQPGRHGKIALLVEHFRDTPDPARGYALAALTGGLDFPHAKPGVLRTLIAERTDPVLFALSYDYVGDLAETISLLWPGQHGANRPPSLEEIVEAMRTANRSDVPGLLVRWLDALDPVGRYALIKLITGGLRIGVSARLAKTALATYGAVPVDEIEELWHGLSPPYEPLFAWLDGSADKPAALAAAPFRPLMLANPLDEPDRTREDPAAYLAEWKWDGIRVQLAAERGTVRLYSRTGDDITNAFPDVIEGVDFDATLDGELLIVRAGQAAPFNDLQQRLNRKQVSAKMLQSHPAAIRLYDLLLLDGEDLREHGFATRRARLEAFAATLAHPRFDLSPLVPFAGWDDLASYRTAPPDPVIEGLMLKRKDAPYVPGRPKGAWWKWKKDPHLVDTVLMYAQRGHGKRSSYYSDFTFGCWTEEDTLVPVGKAYFGFTDEELAQLDKFVRNNTQNRFGPVREVTHTEDEGLVLEIAFEGLNRSARHKSGVAMRFPRIHRIRWDKPPREADRLATLERMLSGRP